MRSHPLARWAEDTPFARYGLADYLDELGLGVLDAGTCSDGDEPDAAALDAMRVAAWRGLLERGGLDLLHTRWPLPAAIRPAA